MPLFHCPMGAVYRDDDSCIDCGLCESTTKEEMVEASKKIREYIRSHPQREQSSKKIAVCGKGGTGKSTISTMIANALSEVYPVIVIDADESNPGLYRMFGFSSQPRPLINLLSGFALDEAELYLDWLKRDKISVEDIPIKYILQRDSLKFLMIGKIDDPFQGCACAMSDITKELVAKLVLKDQEVAIIDTEAGVESFGRGVERSVDTVVVIVEPSFESLIIADKINYLAQGIGINRVRAVLNKIPSKETEEKITAELKKKGVNIIGTVYFDDEISHAGLEGKAIKDLIAKQNIESIKGIVRLLLNGFEETVSKF